ncbi:MAG: 4-hydroxy-tetrahydrodipicolinate reductase [Naasia sp.]
MSADAAPPSVPVSVAIVGATGAMGRLVSRIIEETDGLRLHAALSSSSELEEMIGADVVVDVTLPQVSPSIVGFALAHDLPILVGTSGWSADRLAVMRRQVEDRGLGAIVVPNFSVGSVLSTHFAGLAARYFDSIEIVEAHHAGKIDSPSGTAVRTAETIGAARLELGPVAAPHVDQRARGQQVASVPVHSLRLRGLLAKQEVLFGSTGEVLTITHDTYSHEAYVAGIRIALAALPTVRGLIVGLGPLLGLADPGPSDDGPVDDGAPSGQAAASTP